MAPKIKIDFYRVALPPDATVSFKHILQSVALSPNDASRNVAFRGVPVRLQDASETGIIFRGDMIRIRMDKVPLKVSLAGALEVIELDQDEGMGEETAFYYYAPLQVLLVQRNHFGVSVSALSYYFQRKGNLAGPIQIDPILNQAAYARLSRLHNIKKFDIRLAGIDNFQILRDQGLSGQALAYLMHRLHAPNISVTLSMGRTPGALIAEAVKGWGRELLGFSETQGHINKIEISGRDEEFDEPIIIDLINDRMVESVNVSLDDQKRLSCQERMRALDEAWQRRMVELTSIYSLPQD